VKSWLRSSPASVGSSFSSWVSTAVWSSTEERRMISRAVLLPSTLRMPPATSALSSLESAWPTSRRISGATDSMVAMRRRAFWRSSAGRWPTTATARQDSSAESTSATVCGCSS
jgi:hypothetical protein